MSSLSIGLCIDFCKLYKAIFESTQSLNKFAGAPGALGDLDQKAAEKGFIRPTIVRVWYTAKNGL